MSTLTNWVNNPSLESGSTAGFWNSRGRMTVEMGTAPKYPGASGNHVMLWQQNGDAIPSGTTADLTVPSRAPAKGGQWVRAGFRAWGTNPGIRFRAGLTINSETSSIIYRFANYLELSPNGRDTTLLVQVPEGTTSVQARVGITSSDALIAGGTEEVRMDNFYLLVGDTIDDVPAGYFDGSKATAGGHSYGWDGKPNNSTSYRIDTIDLVHPWTRKWWDWLPNAYKEADANTNLELGGYPLLRWMNGIGQLAGEMRQISDDLWGGKYADPQTVPDGSLRWLAMMLGLSAQHRKQTNDVLRERLLTLTNIGRSAAGTRAMIAESAKAFLTPGAQARVEPSSQRPHVLIMYVRAYEVPDDDLPGLAKKVNDAGFVPAGHIVECKPVVTTWDSWEATAGKTWDEKETNIKTWNESDSAGVVLE